MYINLGYQKCTEKEMLFCGDFINLFYVLFACSVIVAGSEQDSAEKEDTGNKMNTKKEREAVYDRIPKFRM